MRVYRDNDECCGYRRITLELRKTFYINHKKVQRLMNILGIKGKGKNKRKKYRTYQGWFYQMRESQAILLKHGIRQSMSRKGNCLDNAAMESFFGRLKTEYYYGKRFDMFEQLEKTIHEYIHYYNHERIQCKLKGLSPVEYRTQSLN